MLLKCWSQYISKFGKFISGHRTGEGQFSFQSWRRAMPKNVQTTAQLCSFHMLARLCSKFFKWGFSSTWTKHFQIYRLGLEKAEEPQNQIANICWTVKKQGNSRKTYFCFIEYPKAFDCVDHNKLWKILKEMGIPGPLTCLLKNLYAGQETTVKMRHGKTGWFQIGKGVLQGYILSPCLFNVYAEYSFPDLEPVCYSMFGSNCCFLTCMQASQEAGKVV